MDTDINHKLGIYFPYWVRPYILMARLDRPIGIFLLLWPCLIGLFHVSREISFNTIKFCCLFAIGAAVMRAAGCVINDIVDRKIDAQVTRTKGRPLASGTLGLSHAMIFALLLHLVGLVVLLQFNTLTIILGFVSVIPVILYPFMKRITNWPQIFLGLLFNWGAVMACAAVYGEVTLTAILLYVGCIFWTLGYDTIYAHQDKEDDLMVGVKSTALLFEGNTKKWVVGFYCITIFLWGLSGWVNTSGASFYFGLLITAMHFMWQLKILDIDNPVVCLSVFRSNTYAGSFLFFGCILDSLL